MLLERIIRLIPSTQLYAAGKTPTSIIIGVIWVRIKVEPCLGEVVGGEERVLFLV